MTEEARIGDFKRRTTKNFMTLKLGGLLEFAEKATVSSSSISFGCLVAYPTSDRWRAGETFVGGKPGIPFCHYSLTLEKEIPMQSTNPGESRTMYMGNYSINGDDTTLINAQGHDKTEKLEQEVSRCVNEVVFSPANALDANLPENGRYDYAANPSADNSYSNDQGNYPPSQPLSPATVQDNKWPSPAPDSRMMTDHYSGLSPGARYAPPSIGNEDQRTEYSQAEASTGHIPMSVHPHPGERHMNAASDAPPSIDVNFTSDFNPYGPAASPSIPPSGGENPWNHSIHEQHANHPDAGEDGSAASDHKEVRFATSAQEPPFPQPSIPEPSQNEHIEGEAELWIRKYREY